MKMFTYTDAICSVTLTVYFLYVSDVSQMLRKLPSSLLLVHRTAQICFLTCTRYVIYQFLVHNSIYSEHAICYCPSISPSVCHTSGSVKNGWCLDHVTFTTVLCDSSFLMVNFTAKFQMGHREQYKRSYALNWCKLAQSEQCWCC